jgi:virulence-associated protein VagC
MPISLATTNGNIPTSLDLKNQSVELTIPANIQFKQTDNVTNYSGIISVPMAKPISSVNNYPVLSAFKVGNTSQSVRLT